MTQAIQNVSIARKAHVQRVVPVHAARLVCLFDVHGWRAHEIRYLVHEAERLDRPIPLPLWLRLQVVLATSFLSRLRHESMNAPRGLRISYPKMSWPAGMAKGP
jgi:hypothetical protein